MKYCKYLEWRENQDADYYICNLGFETSSDWCSEVEESECPSFDGIII